MFKLTAPGILGMLLISLNAFIDALFTGQFVGETALAGLSLALPLLSIIGSFAFLVGVGSASVLSRAIGSGDIKTQSKIFGSLIIMSVVISFIITIIGYNFSEELILFMGESGEVASAGAIYLKTYVLGSVFIILAIASSQIIKSEGKIRLASIFSGIFVTINIILNALFINIFNWGIRGVAIATFMAMASYSIINLAYFISGKSSIPINLKKITLAMDLLPDILSVGGSELIMGVMSFIQIFIAFKLISHYGTDHDIAFFGATSRLIELELIIAYGFVQALQPMIGMNYGAKNYDRLKKAYLIFVLSGTALLSLLCIPLQLYPETFLGWLLPDVTFISNNLFNFRILSLTIPIIPSALCGITLFLSTGKVRIPVIIILLRNLILFFPLLLLFAKLWGVKGVYFGMFLTDLLIVLILLVLIILEFRKLSDVLVKNHSL